MDQHGVGSTVRYGQGQRAKVVGYTEARVLIEYKRGGQMVTRSVRPYRIRPLKVLLPEAHGR